MLQQNIKIN